jgi:hypothetical protein
MRGAKPTVMALLVAGIAVGGCGGGRDSAGASDSGIRGTVMIGPTCAVEVVGENCADKPYATDIRVIDTGTGEQVATVSSGTNGHFEIALPAGDYRLEPQSSASPPSAAPVEVAVRPDRYASTTIQFDSGIR